MAKLYKRTTALFAAILFQGTFNLANADVPAPIYERASAIAKSMGGEGTIIKAVSRVDDVSALKQATKVIFTDGSGSLQNLIMLPDGQHFIAGPLARYNPESGNIIRGDGEVISNPASLDKPVIFEPFQLDGIFRPSNFTNASLELFSDPNNAPESFMAMLQAAPAIIEGSGPFEITIIIDPNCNFCIQKYQDLRPLVNTNQITVRWIPAIGPSVSPYSKLLALIDPGADNHERLTRLRAMVNREVYEGKVADVEGAKSLLTRTTAILGMLRGTRDPNKQAGTPQSFYKTPDGVLHQQFGYTDKGVEVIKKDFGLK